MIPPQTAYAFLLAALLLAMVPGPDNIFVLTQSALCGARRGIILTLGLCTGLLVYSAAVAFGVALVFQSSTLAFTLLKTLGAAYLVYLAWGAFRAHPEGIGSGSAAQTTLFEAYTRGIVMNLTNPKVAIFFLAFLPQFTSPAWGSLTLQMLELGALFILSALTVFISIALLAGRLAQWLIHSTRSQIILNRSAALIFLLLALKVAMTHQH